MEKPERSGSNLGQLFSGGKLKELAFTAVKDESLACKAELHTDSFLESKLYT